VQSAISKGAIARPAYSAKKAAGDRRKAYFHSRSEAQRNPSIAQPGRPVNSIDIKDTAGKPSGRKFPTNLTNAILSHAKFDKADLRAAILRGAEITRTSFLNALTEGIDLLGARKLN
jgi:hypothetical protein